MTESQSLLDPWWSGLPRATLSLLLIRGIESREDCLRLLGVDEAQMRKISKGRYTHVRVPGMALTLDIQHVNEVRAWLGLTAVSPTRETPREKADKWRAPVRSAARPPRMEMGEYGRYASPVVLGYTAHGQPLLVTFERDDEEGAEVRVRTHDSERCDVTEAIVAWTDVPQWDGELPA